MDARLRPRRGLPAGGPRRRRGGVHAHRPLATDRGEAAAAVGHAPAARAGRPGLRPGEAGVDARDRRRERVGPDRVRQPGAGFRELRDPGPLRDAGPEGAVAASAAGGPPAFGLFDDGARQRGLRSHFAFHRGCAERQRVGDQWPQVVHVQRHDRGLPDRHGGDGSRRRALRAGVDDHRAGGCGWPEEGAQHPDYGRRARALRLWPRRDSLRGRAGARREPTGQARCRLSHRAGSVGPGAHPSLHALAGPGAARLRHAVRARTPA